jgi:ParB/RepB/Spo0J family partition protein
MSFLGTGVGQVNKSNNWLAAKIAQRKQAAADTTQSTPGSASDPQVSAALPSTTQASVVADRLIEDQRDKAAMVLMVSQIEVRKQARKSFHKIEELAESIRQYKQRQPIVVRQIAPHRYLLIHGERRLRAIRDVLKEDTILARSVNDSEDERELRLVQITENVHREDYEPLELAEELGALKHDYGLSNNELAELLHLSKGWVSKKLSLLEAPAEVRARIARGELSETEYYNNKAQVMATVEASARGGAKGEVRTPMVSIPMDVAIELAELLRDLATDHGANPISISEKPTKKELIAIMTTRAREIRGLRGS